MPKLKTKGQVFGIIFIAILILVLLVVAGFNIYQRIVYNEFYSASEKAMPIPDLWGGIVPQGFEYDDETETFYMSGYMENGGSSRVYAFDENGDNVRYAQFLTADGLADDSHAGGFAIWNEYAFLATDGVVNIYMKSDLTAALEQDGGTLTPIYSLRVPLEPAFCYVSDDGYLYTGEFYSADDYETDKSHHMITDCGDNHKSIMAVYKLSEKDEYAIASEVPVAIYSITDRAQGMCITEDGNICIITSMGLSKSHAYIYMDIANGEYESSENTDLTFEVTVDGEKYDIPLYCLDSSMLIEKWDMPPMAEEPVYKGGKIYVMYESASNKYLFGKLSGGTHVYAFPQK